MPTTKLSDALVKGLQPPAAKQQETYYDQNLPGFGLRITSKGSKAFILRYRVNYIERKLTIGSFPTWSTTAARERAKELIRDIDTGKDPLANQRALKEAPTVKDLWDAYAKKHLATLSKGSQADQSSMFKKHILPAFGKRRVAEITFTELQAFHLTLSNKAPYRANRMIEVLRKSFNLAIQWGWIENNPCLGIKRNIEHQRTRYLDKGEVQRLSKYLYQRMPSPSAAIVLLLLLTGARKSEVLSAKWQDFDLKAGKWSKPWNKTKQRKAHIVPISKAAIEVLESLSPHSGETYVFPSTSKDGHQTDLKKFWDIAREALNLNDVRLHDLRHTYASISASTGQSSLLTIGALLGHSSPVTTSRYTHLFDDEMRKQTESIADFINKTESGEHRE
jgi:integrase